MDVKRFRFRRQAGLSMVEFMVGTAVGLLIVVGASKLFADYVVGTKQLMLQTRVNQDLRAAADLVARDLRRAGYWNDSTAGVGQATPVANPHMSGAGLVSNTGSSVSFSYARNAGDTLDANEYGGFRQQLVNGVNVLQVQDGQGNWQAITDPGTVNVTGFSVAAANGSPLTNNLSSFCSCLSRLTCTNTGPSSPNDIANSTFNPAGVPTLSIYSYVITLTGQSVADATVQRTVSETVRVRAGALSGACPP